MLGSILRALLDSLFGAGLKALSEYRREQQLKELGHADAIEAGRKRQDEARKAMEAAANASRPSAVSDSLRNGTF